MRQAACSIVMALPLFGLAQSHAQETSNYDVLRAAQQRMDKIKLIYEERMPLYAKGEAIQKTIAARQREFKALDNRLAAIETEGARLTQTANNIRQQIANLQARLNAATDDVVQIQLQGSIDLRQDELTQVTTRYAALDGDAAEVRGEAAAVQSQLDAANAEMAEHMKECNDLRRQWVLVVDPFGKLPKAEHVAAIKLLTEWIAADHTNASAYLARGHAYDATGESDKAVADFNSAIRIGGGVKSLALAVKGNLEHRLGNKAAAISDMGKAIAEDRFEPMAYVWRCRAYAADGKFPQAEKDIKMAMKLSPQDSAVYRQAALMYLRWSAKTDKKLKLAVDAAKKAVALNSESDWCCHSTLALAYAATGDFAGAISEAELAEGLAKGEHFDTCREYRRKLAARESPGIDLE